MTHPTTTDLTPDWPRLPAASDSDSPPAPRPAPVRRPAPSGEPVRLLVSACLLGDRVRYDGQHKYSSFLVEQLGPFVEWERVCPERDSGMPVPRPSMHLVAGPDGPRLVSRTGQDLTDQLRGFTVARLQQLAGVELCGYVCKKDSPSSGMERVKVYHASGMPEKTGAGLFTAEFRRRFPTVPVEEEGRLNDPPLRHAFLEQIFCRRRWLDLVRAGLTRARLVEFHTDHKLQLLSHGREGYTRLGRLVANAAALELPALAAAYEEGLLAALRPRATPKKLTDVLQHMLGYFKQQLTPDEKAEFLELLDAFRAGTLPLLGPLTLIKHHIRKHGVAYLARQTLLAPYPAELLVR